MLKHASAHEIYEIVDDFGTQTASDYPDELTRISTLILKLCEQMDDMLWKNLSNTNTKHLRIWNSLNVFFSIGMKRKKHEIAIIVILIIIMMTVSWKSSANNHLFWL